MGEGNAIREKDVKKYIVLLLIWKFRIHCKLEFSQ